MKKNFFSVSPSPAHMHTSLKYTTWPGSIVQWIKCLIRKLKARGKKVPRNFIKLGKHGSFLGLKRLGSLNKGSLRQNGWVDWKESVIFRFIKNLASINKVDIHKWEKTPKLTLDLYIYMYTYACLPHTHGFLYTQVWLHAHHTHVQKQ